MGDEKEMDEEERKITEIKEEEIEADIIEKEYKDLKPIREMVSFWKPEGGEYLSCPNCGFIISGKDYIDSSSIYSVIVCGKCLAEWEVFGKLIGYRKYKESE